MKKIKLLVMSAIIAVSSFAYFSNDVSAAYAYRWTVDGEMLDYVQSDNEGVSIYSNQDGSAVWRREAPYEDGGVLTLTNYNGGQLELGCYGTGLGHKFKIELVGENTITVPDDYAIVSSSPIEIIGEGSLKVSAKGLLSSEYSNYKDGNINIVLTLQGEKEATPAENCIEMMEDEDETEEEKVVTSVQESKNENNKEEDSQENSNMIWIILVTVLALVSVVELATIIVFICKKNKMKTPVITSE